MTLGRTSANKIKTKTDGEAGLRAVSCGCCGNCLFDAFSPTPTPIEGAQKFKYLTYEYNLPLYDLGNLDYGRESWRLDCAPAGDDYTCSPRGNYQIEERQRIQYKVTQFLKLEPDVTYEDGSPVCSCHVVKAQGNHELTQDSWTSNYDCWWGESHTPACWNPGSHRAFIAAIQDAEWSTWQAPDTMKLYLDERTREAKWESSFCEGYEWERYWTGSYEGDPPVEVMAWRPGPDITGIYPCPSGNIGCANSGPEPGWQFSSPLEEGGFKIRERSETNYLETYSAGANNTISHVIPFTIRQTLHNTLAEIWGANQLEMRP